MHRVSDTRHVFAQWLIHLYPSVGALFARMFPPQPRGLLNRAANGTFMPIREHPVHHLTSRLPIRLFHPICIAVGLMLIGAIASAQTSPPDGWLDGNINGGRGAWSYNDDGFS